MKAFTVTLEQIDACPVKRLDPEHYRDDGSCRCFEAVDTVQPKSEGEPPAEPGNDLASDMTTKEEA